jgi:hypothetical protein
MVVDGLQADPQPLVQCLSDGLPSRSSINPHQNCLTAFSHLFRIDMIFLTDGSGVSQNSEGFECGTEKVHRRWDLR